MPSSRRRPGARPPERPATTAIVPASKTAPKRKAPGSGQADAVRLPLAHGYSLEVRRGERDALLRVASGATNQSLEIRIVLSPDGVAVRARAASLELESAGDIVARCERFRVEASETLDLVSAGGLSVMGRNVGVVASPGAVRVQANDEVQLLGEQVLLNCERPPPMPNWAAPEPRPGPSVPAETVSGNPVLLELVDTGDRG